MAFRYERVCMTTPKGNAAYVDGWRVGSDTLGDVHAFHCCLGATCSCLAELAESDAHKRRFCTDSSIVRSECRP